MAAACGTETQKMATAICVPSLLCVLPTLDSSLIVPVVLWMDQKLLDDDLHETREEKHSDVDERIG